MFMRSILLKASSTECALLLNGDLSILVRKININSKCELPIDVYLYCTKEKPYLSRIDDDKFELTLIEKPFTEGYVKDFNTLNGKIVAKFTLTKVEHLYEYQVDGYGSDYEIASESLKEEELLEKCCLSYSALCDYLGDINNGYAWFIDTDSLVIFDKPKELKDFRYYWCGSAWQKEGCHGMYCDFCEKFARPLNKAPKTFYYVRYRNA